MCLPAAQDEISTGLDSSTTYLITRCIRNFVHMQDATVLMALLQPAPETFDLFDDVMLLSEGKKTLHTYSPKTLLRMLVPTFKNRRTNDLQ